MTTIKIKERVSIMSNKWPETGATCSWEVCVATVYGIPVRSVVTDIIHHVHCAHVQGIHGQYGHDQGLYGHNICGTKKD